MMSESVTDGHLRPQKPFANSHNGDNSSDDQLDEEMFSFRQPNASADVPPILPSGPPGRNVAGLTRSQTVPPQTSSNVPLSGGSSPPGNEASGSYGFCSPRHLNALNVLTNPTTIDTLKTWSVSTYKCTKQAINERLGKTTRTVDVEVEQSIDNLRHIQQQYENLLRLARASASHFNNLLQVQKQLGDSFTELGIKEPELQEEFRYNTETQRTIVKNGELLLAALNHFINTVNTLTNKTMEDTLLTIKNYETARLEYDAYKSDLEVVEQGAAGVVKSADWASRLHDSQIKADEHRRRYEQYRDDVQVKIKFLSENKVKVMKKQLLLFHNATASFFSGNQAALTNALKQFSIQLPTPSSQPASWLER